MSSALVLGLDVAKATLDLASEPAGLTGQFPNDPTGHAARVTLGHAHPVARIVLAATGWYESAVAAALGVAGLPVAVVNARHVRAFAQALRQLAKTDRIDAAVLARFGAKLEPPVRPLADAETQALAALVQRRRQVLDMLHAGRQRRQTSGPALQARLDAHITWLLAELAETDQLLAAAIAASPLWRALDAQLRQVPGVGPTLSRTLLAELPELGRLGAGDRGPGRGGPLRPGRWHQPGHPHHLGRAAAGAARPVHGHAGRRLLQPGAAATL